jgi:hypothetical protein
MVVKKVVMGKVSELEGCVMPEGWVFERRVVGVSDGGWVG